MIRTLEEYNGKYAGKVAFVLGSGTSMHYQDLEPLKDFVTIAVNSGYVALRESDFFVSDDWSVANWSYYFNDLRTSKTTALLYEGMFKGAQKIFGSRTVFFKHRTGYHITDTYDHQVRDNHILQARTSVGSAIHVAHIMGCSKIVLLGVDCCRAQDYRYFWQFPDFKNKPYRKDKVPIDQYHKCQFEGKKTDDDLVDILRYWRKMGLKMLEKCDIYNASPISTLNVFPKVDLEQFVSEHQKEKKNVE